MEVYSVRPGIVRSEHRGWFLKQVTLVSRSPLIAQRGKQLTIVGLVGTHLSERVASTECQWLKQVFYKSPNWNMFFS